MSRPPRARNTRGEGSRLREEILGAAVALVDETDDPASLTLRGIARRARISAPSIYPHFADLAALVDAVLEVSFDELRERVAAAVASDEPTKTDDPVAALVAAATAYVGFGWDHRARYRLMFDADGYAANAIETFALVQTLVEACADDGSSPRAAPRLDTWILWAGLHGIATLEKPARVELRRLGTLDRPALLEEMVRRLVASPR